MNRFNVLDRDLDLNKHYLLEASAGTGKTFSIENIVIRLLIEESQVSLSQILVVTFTRAATRDLKQRIRANLESALTLLNKALNGQLSDEQPCFDYLAAIIEQGEKALKAAKKRLEDAYFTFDDAQIFTIHSFCSRMLQEFLFEGDVGLSAFGLNQQLSDNKILKVIKDFFRTGVYEEIYSPQQLGIVLNKNRNKIEKVEEALLKMSKRGIDFVETPSFTQLFEQFKIAMKSLSPMNLHRDTILQDFDRLSPSFKKIGDFDEGRRKVETFADLFQKQNLEKAHFDLLIKDGLYLLEALDPNLKKVKAKLPSQGELHHPELLTSLRKFLLPIIEQARDYTSIFARMAYDCQQMVQKYSNEEEMLRFDDLLKKMQQGVQDSHFARKIQNRFKRAIIDEFQDTDPIQWNIFSKLFLDSTWLGRIYLVGDPKQSIYGFRQADIYTYLSASDTIEKQNHASLDTNFRSQPSLVDALNVLFDDELTPGLINLPKVGRTLPYPAVKAAPNAKEIYFNDDLGSLHFFTAKNQHKKFPIEDLEKDLFFPFIVQEIQKLHIQEGYRFDQFAVLIRDRFQGDRISAFLKQYGIAVALQRHHSLSDSIALPNLKEILKTILSPRDENNLKISLGGQIVGWTHEQVLELKTNSILLESVLSKFYGLKSILFAGGIAQCMEELMQTCFLNTKSVIEHILSTEEGLNFYRELQQLVELLIVYQSQNEASPDALLDYLDELSALSTDDEIKARADLQQSGVQILTLHSSKGLEFEIVFALGLINRTQAPELLVPIHNKLKPIFDIQSKEYLNYCQECDAEKIRQLYVAMTRAKHRLYVPAIFAPNSRLDFGSASPMELFLARLGKPVMNMEELYEHIQKEDGSSLAGFLNQTKAHITHGDLTETRFVLEPLSEIEKVELQPPEVVNIPGKPQFIYSFTSITKTYCVRSGSEDLDSARRSQIEASAARGLQEEHHCDFPMGPETGVILHRLLEIISFQSKREEIHAFVETALKNTSLTTYEKEVSHLIDHAFRSSLNGFCLADVAPNKLTREMEFLYPSQNILQIEGFEYQEGFLKGVIDLFFEHQGMYYLVDWKSNWLGPTLNDYSQANMEKAMHEHHYFLQAAIYKEALRRYLKLVDARPFEECFGGVYYLFLRGLDSSQVGYGVYCVMS